MISKLNPFYWCPLLWAPGFCEIDALPQPGQEHLLCCLHGKELFPSAFGILSTNAPVRPFFLPDICLFITCYKGSFKLCDSGVVFVVAFLKCPWNAAGHLLQ